MRAFLFFLGLAVMGAAFPAQARDYLPGPVPAKVIGVIDGDTLKVKAKIWLGQEIETIVRISNIDAPEMKGRCAYEIERAELAKTTLAGLVDGQEIQLINIRTDKYGGRIGADVTAASGNIAKIMQDKGLVRHYQGKARQPWCPSGSPVQAALN
ncbi:MAG: thermonuclease family protein [Dongiaceae bacterium]